MTRQNTRLPSHASDAMSMAARLRFAVRSPFAVSECAQDCSDDVGLMFYDSCENFALRHGKEPHNTDSRTAGSSGLADAPLGRSANFRVGPSPCLSDYSESADPTMSDRQDSHERHRSRPNRWGRSQNQQQQNWSYSHYDRNWRSQNYSNQARPGQQQPYHQSWTSWQDSGSRSSWCNWGENVGSQQPGGQAAAAPLGT